MNKLVFLIKKVLAVILIIGIGLAIFPVSDASAAGPDISSADSTREFNPDGRLEKVWTRLQQAYQVQEERLGKADDFIARVQTLITKAQEKGYDTLAIQSALDEFAAAIPAAESAHETGATIIAAHTGFDESGKVTDRQSALETVKALGQVLKQAHAAMGGTGQALREALRAFRDAHFPVPVSTVPTP